MSISEQSEIISAGLEVSEGIFVLSCTVSVSLADAKISTRKAIEAGVDGYNPVEAKAGLDVVELRKQFPGLASQMTPDVAVGDKVIIHAGFVIEKLDPESAREIEAAWDEYHRVMNDDGAAGRRNGA